MRPNTLLRDAMERAGYTVEALAAAVHYHPKQVGRWVAEGSVPRRADAKATVAELLDVDIRDLWPSGPDGPELLDFHPHRAAVPRETWLRLLDEATEHVDVLAWAATFYHQAQPRIAHRLAEAVHRGARVRLCFGDPSSAEVAVREAEEPLLGSGVLASKIRVSLGYYRELVDVDGIEVRLHRAVLYASLFRYDDEMIVNPHVYSRPASENPVLHLRSGDVFDAYTSSFDVVWDRAEPWKGEQV